MPVFMMFGKYTRDSLSNASAERTRKAVKIIEKNGGKVISMYALLGENDLVFTLDFPDPETPVISEICPRGMSTLISFKLCSRAPRITILSFAIKILPFSCLRLS